MFLFLCSLLSFSPSPPPLSLFLLSLPYLLVVFDFSLRRNHSLPHHNVFGHWSRFLVLIYCICVSFNIIRWWTLCALFAVYVNDPSEMLWHSNVICFRSSIYTWHEACSWCGCALVKVGETLVILIILLFIWILCYGIVPVASDQIPSGAELVHYIQIFPFGIFSSPLHSLSFSLSFFLSFSLSLLRLFSLVIGLKSALIYCMQSIFLSHILPRRKMHGTRRIITTTPTPANNKHRPRG